MEVTSLIQLPSPQAPWSVLGLTPNSVRQGPEEVFFKIMGSFAAGIFWGWLCDTMTVS